MFERDLSEFARHLHYATATDRELLARFADARDELAFAELVGRYGRLVRKVCRNVLRDEHDAEEAWQATFLVLARRANSLHHLEVLAGWLHGVARRISLRARRDAGRRRAREARERPARATSIAEPLAEAAWRELQAILDEELQRLPERLRTPFALCCVEGLGHGEAARRLGWKTGTVSSRLDEARKRLRRRLARRGVSLSGVLSGLSLADGTARAGPAPALASEAVAAALQYVDGAVAGPAGRLARAELRGTLWNRALRAVAIATAVAGALGVGLGAYLRSPEAPPAGLERAEAPLPSPTVVNRPRLDPFGDALPEDAIARLGTSRFGHDYYTEATVWSPDGKIIATLSGGMSARPLCLWDAATGKELRQLAAEDNVWAAAFSPDSKTLAAAENKRGIVLWDVGSGRELNRFTDQGDGVAVDFAPDGRTLAAAGRRGVIHVRQVTSGRLVVELKARGEPLLKRVAFAPDGKTLASTGMDGAVILWDLETGTERWRRKPHGDWAFGLAFAPDGRAFATTGNDDVIRVWDTATGASLCSFGNAVHNAMLIAYSADGRTLASPGPADFVCLWDPATGKEKSRWHTGEQWLESVSYSPDGRTLATTGFFGNRVRLWDPESGTELRPVVGHHALIHGLSFGPDGNTVWSAAMDKSVIRWDVGSGDRRTLTGVHPDGDLSMTYVRTVAFSHDGRSLATGAMDGTVRIWDASGKPVGSLTGHTGGVLAVSFSRDGKLLASSSADSTVRVWDLATNKELRQTKTPGASWGWLAFSPDGQKLALTRGEGESTYHEPLVLDILTGKEILRLKRTAAADDPSASEEYVTFSPDGRTLATVGKFQDSVIRLWDAATGQLIGRCGGETKCRKWSSVSFSPDGRLLATGPYDHDNSVHLWEVATSQEVARLQGHHGGITALAFAPDGRSLASGGGDGTVLVWDLTGRTASLQHVTGPLSPSRLEECWNDLRAEDAAAAYRAVRALAADPLRSVPFLAGRLPSANFAEPAVPFANLEDSSEWLRQRRAVMALEYTATPRAQQVLQTLATAGVATPLAEEARAALDRLTSQPRLRK